MTEEQTIEAADEVVEVAAEPVVKRGRGRPRKEKPIKEKRPRGRPKSLDRCERRDPVVDLGRSGSSERRDQSADLGNGQLRIDLNSNRRILSITRSTIVMLSSQSWKPRKPSHATSTCSCV